jgi:hypothetical protein
LKSERRPQLPPSTDFIVVRAGGTPAVRGNAGSYAVLLQLGQSDGFFDSGGLLWLDLLGHGRFPQLRSSI